MISESKLHPRAAMQLPSSNFPSAIGFSNRIGCVETLITLHGTKTAGGLRAVHQKEGERHERLATLGQDFVYQNLIAVRVLYSRSTYSMTDSNSCESFDGQQTPL